MLNLMLLFNNYITNSSYFIDFCLYIGSVLANLYFKKTLFLMINKVQDNKIVRLSLFSIIWNS